VGLWGWDDGGWCLVGRLRVVVGRWLGWDVCLAVEVMVAVVVVLVVVVLVVVVLVVVVLVVVVLDGL